MTTEELDLMKKSILDSIESYVGTRLDKLAFVKTEIGIISGVGTKKGNKVTIKGIEYDDVKSIGNIIFPNDCVVFIIVPNAQYNNMFILGQLDDTPANIKGGTINIGDGNFKVDKDGNVTTRGDIRFNNTLYVYDSRFEELKDRYFPLLQVQPYNITESEDDEWVFGFKWNSSIYKSGNIKTMIEYSASDIAEWLSLSVMNLTLSENTSFENYGTSRFDGDVYNSSGGTVFVSDKNEKHDIEDLDIEKSAEFIYSQKPVSYKFNNNDSNRNHHGFIAQDVKESMGDDDWGLYIDQGLSDNKDKEGNKITTKGLRYDEFIADIVATCQYQKQQIDDLRKEIEELKNKK